MELFDLYDDERNFTGETIERGKPLPENRYHLVIHICIFGSDGKMLIQQRQPFKKGFPDKWDISVGGSAVAGENSRQAASRELYEELGISHDFSHDRPMLTVHFERGFDDVYVIHKDIPISELKLQPEEVQAAKWADREEIYSLIDSGAFIPYYKSFIDMLFNYRIKRGNFSKE